MARKCRFCKDEIPPIKQCSDAFQRGGFCNVDHMAKHGLKKSKAEKEKENKAKEREAKLKHAEDKKRVKRRSDWLANLQTLVNQYVIHVRDVGKGCCTCGTTNTDIKYDAGHCFTRGARSELRFELTNIHKQCSIQCNVQHSGRQGEHKEFIRKAYGNDHLLLLEDRTRWPSLGEMFPDWQSIEAEIKRYRKLLRDNNIRPNT